MVSEQDAPAVQHHLLIVDDEEHTRTLLRDLCEAAGYHVRTATDGQQAWEELVRAAPDAVLLDLMMPLRDGFSVLTAMREHEGLRDVPVVILTAMGDVDGKIRGMELGADDYITKPFRLLELQTRLKSALLVRDYRRRAIAAEEELAQLRAFDPTTGAGTYAHLKASLDAELARSRRSGRPTTCVCFGFDDYHQFRFRLGREACDGYLRQVGDATRAVLRGADRLFRLEQDQFVLLLPETDLSGALVLVERLSEALARLTALGTSTPLEVVTRFGASLFPQERVRRSEDLLREAVRSYTALESLRERLYFAAEAG